MTRITLIVTGDMERRALSDSLQKIFPNTGFDVIQTPSITSNELTERKIQDSLQKPQSRLRETARLLIAEVDPGRSRNDRADFAILIDDLELVNQHQHELVRSAINRAVKASVENWSDLRHRTTIHKTVRERCSFHLMAPMTETYFFHCDAALGPLAPRRALAPEVRATDPEDFEITSDQDFLQELGRARHPKKYTDWLLTSPDGSDVSPYKEKNQGCAALKALQWGRPLQNPAWAKSAGALFDDIADMLGVPAPFPRAPKTALHQPGYTLRNL
jgi:hypothetical protein